MPARRRRPGSESDQHSYLILPQGRNDNILTPGQGNQVNLLYNNSKPYPNEINHNNTKEYHNVSEDLLLTDLNVIETMNTSRDRTIEFGNAVRSLASSNVARAVSIRDPRKANAIQSHSEFMAIAKTIGRNIASTYTKLEKLTLRKY